MKIQHQIIKLQSKGIIRFANFAEIVYLKADDNYTCFVLQDLSQYIICKTLLNFEAELGHSFFRCHKTYLVNAGYIKEINKRNHKILLTTGESIPFSRNKSRMIEEKMKIKSIIDYAL
jgi:two-component system LytT family response regulator